MTHSRGDFIEYRCFNDCRQEGCPGHKLRFERFNTVDLYEVFDDKGECLFRFDQNEWKAMLKSKATLDARDRE